ncbi:MAG: RdgB/HAM1 family non-canonical purine NTP pyrophosphatase [Lactobacillus sp.]|jgi:XTP/dITP diphosphohydrolase|nr:RdgB/HAM1 family non-canonical purine NTP pyrophosphatase [Lactobacillus sp.]
MKQLLFATTNLNKAQEVEAAFKQAGLPLKILTNADLSNPPVLAETGKTFAENAALKAHALAEFSQLPTLADDSGLMVPALNGEPGVHSARYASDHNAVANNRKLLRRMSGLTGQQRQAKFETVMVMSWPGHFAQDLVVSGEACGEILSAPRGPQTFGYDPLFYVPQLGLTFAEMSTEQKNSLSHRGQAVRALIQALPDWWQQFS